jgi:ribosomal-protein-alanine N-acetyltransferase
MNWFKIRRTEKKDIDGLHRVEQRCFTLPWSRENLAKDATENILAVYYVAEAFGRASDSAEKREPQIVGYAGLWVVAGEGHITNVAVDPDFRRQGVAIMLLLKLLETAREKGAKRFTLEVRRSNEAAITLYERFGFRVVGYRPGYYADNNEDAAIMWTEDGGEE